MRVPCAVIKVAIIIFICDDEQQVEVEEGESVK